jgi:hypothetical protein
MPPEDTSRMWAVLLELRDNVRHVRFFLEGGIGEDGKHHPGFIAEHNRLVDEVERLQSQKAQQVDRRWVVALGAAGALITKGLDLALSYFQQKGPHP